MKRKIIGLVLAVTLVLWLLGTLAPAATNEAHAQGASGGELLNLSAVKLPPKGNPKLDSQLNQLIDAEARGEAAAFARQAGIPLAVDEVRVIIESEPGFLDSIMKTIVVLGGSIDSSYQVLLQVVVPINQLTVLANTPGIRFVSLPRYPVEDTVSEGLPLINANEWQAAGFTGAGVKIAILDGGFIGYTSLLGTELPASVTTNSFFAAYGNNVASYTNHGTACAEIVYDIAPNAQFYLVNSGTNVELGNAVDWLIAQHVDIISYSMGWPTLGPGDGTGPICQIVDKARAAGILWVSAAGNSAQRHWQGDFIDPNHNGLLDFIPDVDEANAISVNNGYLISLDLKWNDPWGTSSNDYDLFLLDRNGDYPVAYSVNTQDGLGGNDYPIEYLDYTANYTGYYYIVIGTQEPQQVVNFHLFSGSQNLHYQTASSSFLIPADSPNAMTVGAVPWNNPTTIEPFSSRGPTTDNRTKPDLVAPDGVSSATYGTTGFYGTSAATPHAAGAAALVKQYHPSFNATQIQSYLEGRAVGLGDTGKDNLYGSGRLYLTSENYTLTMAVSGNGTVIPAVGGHSYMWGTVISINATPASGWQFVNWTGSVADNASTNTTVTMNADKTVTAIFSEIPVTNYTLTIGVSGNGTTIPPVGSHVYPPGTVVSINATPASGWQFVNWTGDTANSTLANTTVTMNANKTVTANFERPVAPGSPGDANSDGRINSLDITKVELIIARLSANTSGADANQDGKVNARDITRVEMLVGGVIDSATNELSNVQSAVFTMMIKRNISNLATAGATLAVHSYDMTHFPDTRGWGYVLYGANVSGTLVNYFATNQTAYYYSVDSLGSVTQGGKVE